MDMNMNKLKKRIAAASKRAPADLVIKNGKIIDVFNLEIIETDVAIQDGEFVGLGDYEGKQVIDANGKFVCPSFIDGHIHIESSMVKPSEYAKVVLPHGITTIIADPHEIANVSGTDGIRFMLEASEDLPLDVYMMMPSCVPATPFENTGAELNAEQLEPFYSHDRVLGLGEVMNFPAVYHGEEGMLHKIADAFNKGNLIDGHAAGLHAEELNVYLTAGIRTDHECVAAKEALERIQRGMYVMIREGTASKDLDELIQVVNEKNARRFLFVTDDKHLDELIAEGSIDHNVRKAINKGINPLLAIQIATLNAAECFRLSKKGAIAPGYEANFLFLDDLESVSVSEVYKAGKLVAKNGECLPFKEPSIVPPESVTNSITCKPVSKDDLRISLNEEQHANIIEVIPNSIITNHLVENIAVKNGQFQPSIEKDLLKIAVVERHKMTGNIGLGIVKGLGLKSGAIVSTVAHDSHNIVVAGTNDDDILKAIRVIGELGGGQAVLKDGEVLASLPLPFSGLMSDLDYMTVNSSLGSLNKALRQIGFIGQFNPFSTLSFLALPVIPKLKITDLGLFDVESFEHIPIALR